MAELTEEVWDALLTCINSAENNDDSMSGWLTDKSEIARAWLEQQEWVD